jgi:FkbM family methyltransferase
MIKRIVKTGLNGIMRPLGLEIRRWRRSTQYRYAECLRLAMNGVERPLAIDIGAHEGQSAVAIRQEFPNARVLSIEPSPHTFARLQARAGENGFECFNLALGEAEGTRDFNCYEHSQCNSLLPPDPARHAAIETLRQPANVVRVPVTTLDRFMHERDLAEAEVHYLKVDVQGFEDRVLRGAPVTLAKTRHVLIEVSFCRAYADGCLVDEVCQLIGGQGFKLITTIGYMMSEDEDELLSTDFFFSR